MPKIFTSKSQKIGEIAEYVAEKYFVTKGFLIRDRNHTRKWGEIDIVAVKDKVTHFVEVKSGRSSGDYRAEENMHPRKIQRLRRVIQSYLAENKVQGEWQVDLAVVGLNLQDGEATVKVLENIIL